MGASASPHGPGLIDTGKQLLPRAGHPPRIQNHRRDTVASWLGIVLQNYDFLSHFSFISHNIKKGSRTKTSH